MKIVKLILEGGIVFLTDCFIKVYLIVMNVLLEYLNINTVYILLEYLMVILIWWFGELYYCRQIKMTPINIFFKNENNSIFFRNLFILWA